MKVTPDEFDEYGSSINSNCPFCMQPAGSRCVSSGGVDRAKPHIARKAVAEGKEWHEPEQQGDPMDIPPGRDDDLAEAYRNGYNAGTIDARRNVLKVTMGMLGADGFLDVLSKHAIEDLFSE